MFSTDTTERESVLITTGPAILAGRLNTPPDAIAVVILVNGLGTMKHETADPFAARLNDARFSTLCVDLMTPDEAQFDSRTGHFSGDAELQSERILTIADWLRENPSTSRLPIAAVAGGWAGRGLLRSAAADSSSLRAIVVDATVKPSDVPDGLAIPLLLFMQDDAIEMRRAQAVSESLAGPATLRVLSSVEAARSINPIYSDAAGVIAAEWLSGHV